MFVLSSFTFLKTDDRSHTIYLGHFRGSVFVTFHARRFLEGMYVVAQKLGLFFVN